jgi:hypothetical protein
MKSPGVGEARNKTQDKRSNQKGPSIGPFFLNETQEQNK